MVAHPTALRDLGGSLQQSKVAYRRDAAPHAELLDHVGVGAGGLRQYHVAQLGPRCQPSGASDADYRINIVKII